MKNDKICAADAKNGLLRVPGGSFTKGISNETQCYLEAKEEAHRIRVRADKDIALEKNKGL